MRRHQHELETAPLLYHAGVVGKGQPRLQQRSCASETVATAFLMFCDVRHRSCRDGVQFDFGNGRVVAVQLVENGAEVWGDRLSWNLACVVSRRTCPQKKLIRLLIRVGVVGCGCSDCMPRPSSAPRRRGSRKIGG